MSAPKPRAEGFLPPHYTQIPDEILDRMGERPYTETLVLLYIARRTFGFRRQEDTISYDQFLNGIVRKDGERLDTGCGIKSRTTLAATIKSLEEQGLLVVERKTVGKEKQTTTYRLRLLESEVVHPVDHPVAEVVHLLDYRSPSAGLGVVHRVDIQQTGLQQTGLQQTEPPCIPPAGGGDAPSPVEDGGAPDLPDRPSPDTGPPPPTPSPPALAGAEQRLLEVGRRPHRPSRGGGDNGWAEQPPERLERIRQGLWDGWREKNPSRVSRRDLARVASSVAPDEVRRFQERTRSYLKEADPEFVMGLKRWLEEWRDWQPRVASYPSQAQAPSVYQEQEAMMRLGRTRKEA